MKKPVTIDDLTREELVALCKRRVFGLTERDMQRARQDVAFARTRTTFKEADEAYQSFKAASDAVIAAQDPSQKASMRLVAGMAHSILQKAHAAHDRASKTYERLVRQS